MADKPKVLVVDDQKAFREAVAFEFEMMGYEQILAENGQDAFEKYQTNDIDLIICDIRMPVWDGKKFLNELRKIAKTKPPFIFMTGFADLQPSQAFQEGADAFIGKPIPSKDLEQIVKQVMSPLSERLRKKPNNSPSISISEKISTTNDFQIGRLGFFLSSKATKRVTELKRSDLVEFNISCDFCPITDLEGIGKVLWTRSENIDNLKQGVGIQIEYLTDKCRNKFIEYVTVEMNVVAIPIGTKDSEANEAKS